MSINILDCTLRDGGYYNLWNFKLKDVQNYLNQISKSKITIIASHNLERLKKICTKIFYLKNGRISYN